MGQIAPLIWKNFQFVRRHPFKALLMLFLPVFFLGFLALIVQLSPINNVGDCDYKTIALFSSDSTTMIAGLACNDFEKCINSSMPYFPPHLMDEAMMANPNYTAWMCNFMGGGNNGPPPESEDNSEDEDASEEGDNKMPNITELREQLFSNRKSYGVVRLIDFLYNGKIFFYRDGDNATQQQVITLMDKVVEIMDQMYKPPAFDMPPSGGGGAPRIGGPPPGIGGSNESIPDGLPMMGLNDSDLQLARNMEMKMRFNVQYGMLYIPLGDRVKYVDNKTEALRIVQEENDIKNVDGLTWGLVEINDMRSNFKYKQISHFNFRDHISTLYLQALIEAAIIQTETGSDNYPDLLYKLKPFRCHKDPANYNPAFSAIGFALCFGMMMFAYVIASEICAEKAAGLVEFLMIAGVPRWKLKVSWFIYGLPYVIFIGVALAVIIKYIDSRLIEHTPIDVMLVFLLLYVLSLLCLCFCIASLVSTPQRAGLVMFTTIMVAFLAPQWGNLVPEVGYEGGTLMFVRFLCFIHPTFSAQIGMAYILGVESNDFGITWDNLSISPGPVDQFGGMKEIMLYLVIQVFMYHFLSWFFDHTAPSKYGIKWPVWFCCLPSYWRCGSQNAAEDEDDKQIQSDIEPAPSDKPIGIQVRNLTKSYGKGKYAVDHLSVPFFRNEITALLGHNGAGKSTTMNMLTGMIGPTSGTAYIDGNNIVNEMDTVRKKLGFCPQYDIIYPELTVRDHIKFYGKLKGLEENKVMDYAMDIFKQMKMLDALDRPAMALSGGMKRKLSIAISFLGDPTTIILDEPTSAIDPFSRRAIWDTILTYRSRSTVLISTHYMQEADVLGDRIAIIDSGQLKCFGSPMYLKSRYGSGSKILLAHHKEIDAKSLCDELQNFCPVTLLDKSKTETTFGVSIETARSTMMEDCFKYLEENKTRWGITSFGLAESTMEQVFFAVAEGGGTPENLNEPNAKPASKLVKNDSLPASVGSIYVQQFIATIIKRFHLGRKSIIALVFQIVAPMIFMVILWAISRSIANSGALGDAKDVHFWDHSSSSKLFFSGDTSGPFASSLVEHGLGTRCIANIENVGSCIASENLPEARPFDGIGKDCDCTKCYGTGDEPVLWQTLRTKDNITNLSGRNISDFMLKTEEDIVVGIESTPRNNDILWGGIVITRGRPNEDQLKMRSIKSAFLNGYNNILLRARVTTKLGGQATSTSSTPGKYAITMYSEEQSFKANEIAGVRAVGAILMGFFGALALMMPIFAVLLFMVTENVTGNKQLQLLMGMNAEVYWVANYLWDFCLFVISVLLMCGFMSFFPETFDLEIQFFFTISIFYGIGMIMLSYVLTFIMGTARMAILIVGMTAPIFSMACLILLSWRSEDWYDSTIFMLNFFPPAFLTDSLMVMEFNKLLPESRQENILTWDLLGKRFMIAVLFTLTMLIIVVLVESGLLRMFWNQLSCDCSATNRIVSGEAEEIDADVKKEEDRVLSNESAKMNDVLRVKQLVKTYKGGKTAVKGVSLGVHKGECFGLLGVNGAGKTTMFQMLTGYHPATSGEALLMGHSIFGSPGKVAKHMSYCPQQDVLFESLTPTEHLHLYGRIRGMTSDDRNHSIPLLIEEIGLTPHVKKQSHALSGGNKRKLNFAIAMLGFPDVVFLDEMTTGMDPKARRAAWNVLENGIKAGCAAVITSHSMEECESLCKRLVIMVNGKFKCIGGVQYLKDKYGNNYNVKIRLGPGADADEVLAQMQSTFTAANLVEKHIGYVEIEIAANTLTLSHLFHTIHELKKQFNMEDFSVSQTTLEHVFVNMVREQE